MLKVGRLAVVGALAAAMIPAAVLADDSFPYAARVILKPGESVRIPADRTALIMSRLNGCYLGLTGGAGKSDLVLESKDEVRGVSVLGGEQIRNLGGTTVRGGSFPRVSCLVSLLLYGGGANPAVVPVSSTK